MCKFVMYIRMGWTLTGTLVGCKNRGLNNIAIIVIAYIPSIVYHLKILKGKTWRNYESNFGNTIKAPQNTCECMTLWYLFDNASIISE